jgi:hypothetical protein
MNAIEMGATHNRINDIVVRRSADQLFYVMAGSGLFASLKLCRPSIFRQILLVYLETDARN